MLILDTNVISEVLRPAPDAKVVRWFESQPRNQLFTTAVTMGEVLYGIELLPKGSRRQKLLGAAKVIFEADMEDHVLAFDSEASSHFALISSARRQAGRPISQFDAMIAAIAKLNGATLATRNISDFTQCGIELIDPWENC